MKYIDKEIKLIRIVRFINQPFFIRFMAKLRKFVAYRSIERPYTRKSKFKNKNFVRGFPNLKIVRFEYGSKKKDYQLHVYMTANEALQIRHQAFESTRMTINRFLEKTFGKNQYFLRIRPFPHHVLRENPLASGAGADRMSTGMKKSFGKPIGAAARIKEGQIIIEIYTMKNQEEKAKLILKRGAKKLPGSYSFHSEPFSGEVQ